MPGLIHCEKLCLYALTELQAWRELEVAYGNEDTFKDMLRIKRR